MLGRAGLTALRNNHSHIMRQKPLKIKIMNKIVFMAASALMATAAMAQNPDGLKQVMSATDYESALQLTEAAVSTMTAEEKAKAYNKVVDLALEKYTTENEIAVKNELTKANNSYDKDGMEAAAVAAINYAIVCDEYDQMPNEKGKVKVKYKSSNVTRLTIVRNELLGIGEEQFNAKDFAAASKTFGLYVDSAPFFYEGNASSDPAYGQIAYYTSLACYNSQSYVDASKYAALAQTDTTFAEDALNIQIMSMKAQLNTKADSLKYLDEVKALYEQDPTNERFFGLLCEYYATSGEEAAKNELVDKQLEINPKSTMAWALKGEGYMGNSQWDEAITTYKKSLEINPDFIQVRLNLSVCLNNKAITLKEANNGQMTDEAKACVNESISNLKIIREEDPNRETVNWPYTFYQAYYLIDDEAGMKEIEPLLK